MSYYLVEDSRKAHQGLDPHNIQPELPLHGPSSSAIWVYPTGADEVIETDPSRYHTRLCCAMIFSHEREFEIFFVKMEFETSFEMMTSQIFVVDDQVIFDPCNEQICVYPVSEHPFDSQTEHFLDHPVVHGLTIQYTIFLCHGVVIVEDLLLLLGSRTSSS